MVSDVAAGTAFLEIVGGYGGKVQGVIQFSECQQSGVGLLGIMTLFGTTFSEATVLAITLCIATVSSVLALFALFFSVRSDLRKTGIGIRCDFAISSSIATKEQWISKLELQNMKDRSVTVYEIFIELGHGMFVQIEDRTQQPLVLEPYGLFTREYDPVETYVVDNRQLIKVLDSVKSRRRVVLVTSQGRYYPKRGLRKWHPIFQALSKNHATGVVWPVRRTYKGHCYGSEVNFIVTFTNSDGTEEVIPIYPKDHELKKFGNFQLTKEATESKEALERLLQDQIDADIISCKSFDIFDPQPTRQRLMEQYPVTLEMPNLGWFQYNVIARVQTVLEKRRLERINKETRAKNEARYRDP